VIQARNRKFTNKNQSHAAIKLTRTVGESRHAASALQLQKADVQGQTQLQKEHTRARQTCNTTRAMLFGAAQRGFF
jgi:hypothetical protein